MSTISNTVGNSVANRLAQPLAVTPSKQILNNDQSLPVSGSSGATKSDILNSQLISLMNKWSDAKQAINTLANAPQQISQSRKAMAAEMLKRIKEQIRMMMMLAGGDPKARARQIAVLARELAAAAREYAAASGDSSQTSVASAAGGAEFKNGNMSSTEQIDSVGSTANATGAPASTTEVAAQPDQNIAQASPTAATSPAETVPLPPTSTHQVYEQLANKISEYNQESSASKEDQEFALEVRRLAAQLKALAKQNEVRPHKGADQSTEHETAATNEALREVEHSLSIIESPNVSTTPSINIMAR